MKQISTTISPQAVLVTGTLTLLIIVMFRLGFGTPAERLYVAVEPVITLACMGIATLYLVQRLTDHRIHILDLSLLLLLIPVALSFVTARNFYGQTYIDSLVVQRPMFSLFIMICILFAHRSGVIRTRDVVNVLVVLGAASCLLLLVLKFTGSVSMWGDAGGRISSNELRLDRIRFGTTVVCFMALYSGHIAYEHRKFWGLVGFVSGWLALFLVLQERNAVLCMGMTCVLYVALRAAGSAKRTLFSLIGGLAVIASLTLLVLTLNNDFTDRLVKLYGPLFEVFITGNETGENSIDSRLYQLSVFVPRILDSPVLGNGFLKPLGPGALPGIPGRVYISDIGILGAVFCYGILGFCVILYFVSLCGGKMLNLIRRDPDPILYFISSFFFYVCLRLIVTNIFIATPGVLFLSGGLLWMMSEESMATVTDNEEELDR